MVRRPPMLAVAGASLAATVAATLGLAMPQESGAVFTSASRSTATVRAASDWTPPTVEVTPLAGPVAGTVTVAVRATDGESGVRSVAVEVQSPGGTWAPVCTDSSAPFACAWDTTTGADGDYALRAVATDGTGLSTTSATVRTTVANRRTLVLAPVADDVRGAVPLTATLSGSTSGFSVRFEYADSAGGPWRTLCTDPSAPYTCSWTTTALADGDYDLRAVAVAGGVSVVSDVLADVHVDNTAPTVTMVNPGSPLRGSVTFAATADDADSGVDTVTLQYAATGTTTWRDLCTVLDEPWSCSYRTTQLADGGYSFRAVAVDVAGNAATSATVAQRVVDNTVASVSVDDPGAYLRGTVTLTAAASSSVGVASVRIQRAVSGSTSWVEVCTDTTAPYTCAWNTTAVAAGAYDLRAVMTDTAGRATTSAVVTGRRVDNSPLRAVDVQSVVGGTAGRVDAGDVVTLTYSREVDLATLSPGWTGAPLAVTARLRDGWYVGTSGRNDVLDVMAGRTTLDLGFVALRENHVSSLRTATFDAVLTARTVQVDGVPATQVTLTVGRPTAGKVRTVSRAATMAWYPSAGVADRTGAACSGGPATESGSSDKDF